ncbi:MAG: hypothetical protein J0H91_17605 [Rhodospirillales bacterium]|nr:hypothetical protein [Rhodospirillales bacterium]
MNRLRVAVVSAGIGARHVAGFNAVPGLFQAAVINSLGWLVWSGHRAASRLR